MGQAQTWLWPLESPDPQGLSPHPMPLLQRQEVMEGTQQQLRPGGPTQQVDRHWSHWLPDRSTHMPTSLRTQCFH